MLSRAGEAAGNPNWQAKTVFNSHLSPACLTACFSGQFFEASIHIVTLPVKIAPKSIHIVEPGARVANTLRRAALRGRADQPSAVNKGRKCKTCGNYVSKKFIPYCTCTK